MTKPWHFHPEAHEELTEAAEYYEQKKPGLGDAFLHHVEASLTQLESAPMSAAVVPHVTGELRVRRGFVARFPYAIVFVELESEFQIVAIAHLRRHPGYWGLRLKRLPCLGLRGRKAASSAEPSAPAHTPPRPSPTTGRAATYSSLVGAVRASRRKRAAGGAGDGEGPGDEPGDEPSGEAPVGGL
jgi:plasmid stabilization system protein ParE